MDDHSHDRGPALHRVHHHPERRQPGRCRPRRIRPRRRADGDDRRRARLLRVGVPHPRAESGPRPVIHPRYFSPKAEVPFCGHATVATAVALGEQDGVGDLRLPHLAGHVPVTVREDGELTRHPHQRRAAHRRTWPPQDVAEALAALGLAGRRARRRRCRPGSPTRAPVTWCWPPRPGNGWRTWTTTSTGCAALMERLDLTTVQLVWRESADRLPRPRPVPGRRRRRGRCDRRRGRGLRGVRARARASSRTTRSSPCTRAHDMGRPSLLEVDLRAADPRVRVSGAAIRI